MLALMYVIRTAVRLPPVRRRKLKTMINCRVCFLEHDEEIHTATLNVRAFLRARLQTVLGLEGTRSIDTGERDQKDPH